MEVTMRNSSFAVSFLAAALLAPAAAFAQSPGAAAPAFTLTDTAGNSVQLADYRGKYVVLEWTNPECPFVRKHYISGNMQELQKEWGAREVVWLSINSTSTGSYEFKTPAQMAQWMQSQGAAQKATLIDGTSAAARSYAARATPHMFVIDPAGAVLYNGAIDDRRTSNPADAKVARNYVRAALTEAMAGKPVTVASTSPYGCSIKY
jgi:peroxiredoxin